MAKKKKQKKGSQSETLQKLAMATAILNHIREVLDLAKYIMEQLTE